MLASNTHTHTHTHARTHARTHTQIDIKTKNIYYYWGETQVIK